MQNVKTRSTLKAIFFTIITFGLYYFVWLYKLVKDLNALDIETTKKLSYWKIISVLIIILFLVEIVLRYFFNDEILPSIYYCFSILEIIFLFVVNIILLRKIEEYSEKKYNVVISHNIFYIFLFDFFYVNFAINNFQKRIENVKNGKRTNNKISTWIGFYILVIIAFSIIALEYYFDSSCRINEIVGFNMDRTIETGDIVLSNNKVNEYERGDIVIYTDYENKRRISRIIGLPNEIIEIKGNNVLINGKLLQEDYINEEYEPIQCDDSMFCGPVKVEEGTYYLLGDNRGYSFDSRFQGLISKSKIKAKVKSKYFLVIFETFLNSNKMKRPNYTFVEI